MTLHFKLLKNKNDLSCHDRLTHHAGIDRCEFGSQEDNLRSVKYPGQNSQQRTCYSTIRCKEEIT